METESGKIGCVLMASGMSVRYGKNKLLEKLGDREVLLHTADHLLEAGLHPLAVIRSREMAVLLEREGIRYVFHDGTQKSDTIHTGIKNLDSGTIGYLFMPGDQPLVQQASVRKLVERFLSRPSEAVRLGFQDQAGSPVLFPTAFRKDLLDYTGDRGGMEVLKRKGVSCEVIQADHAWELWDVDTPEKMERVRQIYRNLSQKIS